MGIFSPVAALVRALPGPGLVILAAVASGCVSGSPDGLPDPQSVAAYDVANDDFRKGNLREALAKVNEALKLDPRNAEAAHLGALIHLSFCAKDERSSDCRLADAERFARTAARDETNREAKNTLGVILIHEKKLDEAIEVLKPLTNDILYGSPQTSWGNLGLAFLEKGSYNEAIDALRRSVAAQPAFCVGNYRLGLAYEKKGEMKAAREAFVRAVETERKGCKNIQEAWEARARAEKSLGLLEEARLSFGQCAELSRGTPSGTRCDTQLKGLPPRVAG